MMPTIIWGDRYTVEPGVTECRSLLRFPRGGGFGAKDPIGTKYYNYRGNNESVSLDALLDLMQHVDDDVRYYCTTNAASIEHFLWEYLNYYAGKGCADSVILRINGHLASRNHADSGFSSNIVVGTAYFNDIFYETARAVADQMLSSAVVDACYSQYLRECAANPRYYSYPFDKWLVNLFDSNESVRQKPCLGNEIGIPSVRFGDLEISCPERVWESSIGPYVYFLSNWTLLLGVYLCVRVFGQCAFGIYWETGYRALR